MADANQLEQMWRMLDDLAASNPAEYDRLISNARSEVQKVQKESEFVPKPTFVVESVLEKKEAVLSESSAGPFHAELFVNVCISDRCLAPYSNALAIATSVDELDSCTIPVSVGARREDNKGEDGRKRLIYDIVVNPLVYKRVRSDAHFKGFVGFLVLERVTLAESQRGSEVRLRKSSMQFPNVSYKAGQKAQSHSLAADCDPKIFALRSNDQLSSNTVVTKPEPSNIKIFQDPVIPGLIEVVEERQFSVPMSLTREGGRDWAETVNGMIGNESCAHSISLEVKLIIGTSVTDFDIEGEGQTLLVELPGFEPLTISWEPQSAQSDFDNTTAKFISKTCTLLINIPSR